MENKEQVYSIDGSKWDTYDGMMSELRSEGGYGDEVDVWEADKKEFLHIDFVTVAALIDEMQVRAQDDYGEIADDYLQELTTDQKKGLEKHIAKWFNKNAKLNFYGVENEHKIVVIVE